VIAEILPAVVASAEAFGDPPEAALFPAEAALLVRAVEKRRAEFATGRHCARNALGALGLEPTSILPGQGGAPQWPSGIVGSITHCAGYRAAAVARAGQVLTIGLDAEPAESLPGEVLGLVTRPGERDRLRDLARDVPGVCWDTLLFSAKESVYKAWFPLARRWLGFSDADITINAVNGTFEARLLIAAPASSGVPNDGFSGRWLARDGLLLTAITVLA
jgi:enterobactin synthetase component D / holo-[acyl-carrier protein] synthase